MRSRTVADTLRTVVVVLAVLVTSFGITYPYWWNHRSTVVGHELLKRALAKTNAASPTGASSPSPRDATTTTACSTAQTVAFAPQGSDPGVLEIPAIGLVAPVLQGIEDSVLNVAVGHLSTSPWPGQAGESLVLADDVSYFADLEQVKAGDEVIWLTPCAKATFAVTDAKVLAPGDDVASPPNTPGLALVTCYPTDALFWTTKRYVVNTKLVSETIDAETPPALEASAYPPLTVRAPAALVAEGLTLATNSLPLGSLSINGSPSASFAEGPGPLSIERDALEVYFGAEKAVQQHNSAWWSDLAVPGLSAPSAWPSFGTVNVTITMDGSTPRSVTIVGPGASATIDVAGNVALLSSISSVTGSVS